MNAGIKLAAVYVAVAILVAGCGQSNSGSAGISPGQPAAAAKPAESKPAAPKDASIKIKGLYIGMDIQTVPALLKEKLAGKIITDVAKGSVIIAANTAYENNIIAANTANKYNLPDRTAVEINTANQLHASFGFLSVLGAVNPENFYVSISNLDGYFEASPDGKVTLIVFTGSLVNELFNAADMDASAFVQQFISAYNISEMKVSDNMKSWDYTSPNGEKVTIDTTKEVVLKKVASAQDRKQSFN